LKLSEVTGQSQGMKLSDITGPFPIVGDGETQDSLRTKFWQAKVDGDEKTAASVWHRMASEGFKMGDPPPELKQQYQDAAAKDMGAGEKLFARVGGMGRTVIRAGRQAADIGAAQLFGVGAPAYNDYNTAQQGEAAQREQDASLKKTPVGYGTTVVGNALPFALAAIASRGTGLADLVMPRAFAGATLQGDLLGLAQPTAPGESRLVNEGMGAIGGGAGYGVFRGLGALADAARGEPLPFTTGAYQNSAARVIRDAAQNPANLTRSAPSSIPGVQRSLAEQTLDPGIAQLQRQFPVQMAEQSAQNDAARHSYIRGQFQGGTEDAANTLRDQAAGIAGKYLPDIRKATGAESIRVVQKLDRMAKAPMFRNFPETQGFLSTARDMIVSPIPPEDRVSSARSLIQSAAANPGRGSSAAFDAIQEARRIVISGQRAGQSPEEISAALRKVKGLSAQNQAVVGDALRLLRTTEKGKPDVASLYNARKYITQELMPRLSGQSMMAARSFLRDLDNEIVQVAPTFKQYLSDYSAQMRLADQAKVGARLLDKGATATEHAITQERPLTPHKVSSATNSMDTLVRQATGFPRAKADRVLTPAQRLSADNLRADMQRVHFAQTEGRGVGSPTAQNTKTLARATEVAGGMLPIPNVARRVISGAVNGAAGAHQRFIDEQVAFLLKNPQQARAVLSRLPVQQRQLVMAKLGGLIGNAAAFDTTSALQK
jgi:hypothetical protein